MREFCFVKGKKNLVPGASDSVPFHMRVQTFTFGVLTDFCLATVSAMQAASNPATPNPALLSLSLLEHTDSCAAFTPIGVGITAVPPTVKTSYW